MRSLLILLLISAAIAASSQTAQTISVNTLNPSDGDKLTRSAFHYPRFSDGKVVFKDSVEVEARMNYNRIFGQVLFISQKGDTLALSHPETFLHVVIFPDTFYYYNEGFLRKLTHYKGQNLAVKQKVDFVGKEKQGPYGTYSPLSATNSNTTVTTDNQITTYIGIDENHIYQFNNEFYISDGFNNFFRASKKNFYNLFSKQQKQLKAYLDSNKVDYNKQADLEKLMAYLHGL